MKQAVHSGSRYSAAITLIALVTFMALCVTAWLAFNPVTRAPDVTFTLLSGQKVSTQQLAGKVYIVNFWTTSCTTCMKEMPQMVNLYRRFQPRGLELIAVAMSYDTPRYVINYHRTRQLPFKVAIDDGRIAQGFGNVQLTPTMFVINKKGRVLKRYLGVPDFDELSKLLTSVLAQPV